MSLSLNIRSVRSYPRREVPIYGEAGLALAELTLGGKIAFSNLNFSYFRHQKQSPNILLKRTYMNIGLDNFEQLVDAAVLQRGVTYFNEGLVLNIEVFNDRDFNAIVLGSEAYNVNIVLDKNQLILTHRCSCPFDQSPVCKHKAALLFAMRAAQEKGESFEPGNLHKIKTTIDVYSKEELQQLIFDMAKQNLQIRNKLFSLLVLQK